VGEAWEVGFKQAMAAKAVRCSKGEDGAQLVARAQDSFVDVARAQLLAVEAGEAASVPVAELTALAKKRKLVEQQCVSYCCARARARAEAPAQGVEDVRAAPRRVVRAAAGEGCDRAD